MDGAGLLSTLDSDALKLYIGLWSRLRHARSRIEPTGGLVITASNGIMMANPWLKIASDTEKELARYLDAFGLTPKSRSKLAVTEPDDVEDKWKVFG